MTVAHRAIECRPRTQRFLGHAGNNRITVFDALLIDDPCPQFFTGKPSGDSVRRRINVVSHWCAMAPA
jgi:hypothetical protein